MRSSARSLPALLVPAAVAALLLAPGGASAAACKKGFVKNQGRCVKKPPKGIPAPGFYKVSNASGEVNFEVRYETFRGAFHNKFIVLAKLGLAGTGFTCTSGTFAKSLTLKTDRARIVGTGFKWNAPYNGLTSKGTGKFPTVKTATFSPTTQITDSSGLSCVTTHMISGTIKKSSYNNTV